MKRLGRLFFDLIALALGAAAIVMGFIALLGDVPALKDAPDAAKSAANNLNLLREVKGDVPYYLSIISIALGALASFFAVIGIILVFKSGSHKGITTFAFLVAIIAIAMAVYVI